ncbi:MAG: UDP-glucose dehydrogenase family protein, partial [Beijerinckiaceae bacterium]
EPGLEELVERNVAAKRLRFSTDLGASVADRDAVFIAVGTPSDPATGKADLQYVRAAVEEVARSLTRDVVLVTKSTVPVGTNRGIGAIAAPHLKPGVNVFIASNPEFLREGAAIADFMEPDRVLLGVDDPRALDVMQRIYAPLIEQDVPLVVTSVNTAEVAKYASNAFLSVKVSFINEMADLCEAVDADIEDVVRSIGLDKRIGAAYLRPGPGWGGSCLPKDTRALQAVAEEKSVGLRIVGASIEANMARKEAMAKRIIALCGGDVRGRRLALLGLTFKGQTDDMRESPSIDIVRLLDAAGAELVAYDPSMPHDAARLLPNVRLASSAVEAARDAEAIVLITDWKVFRSLDFAEVSAVMRTPRMIDLRNYLDEAKLRRQGFTAYHRLGRPHQA